MLRFVDQDSETKLRFVCQSYGCEDVLQYDYVRLDDPEEDIHLMDGPQIVVIPENWIKIKYTYPLRTPIIKEHGSKSGFTREDLVRLISRDYRQIYQTPENLEKGDYRTQLNFLVLNGLQKEGEYYVPEISS